MLKTYWNASGRLRPGPEDGEDLRTAVWLDLVEPTAEDERRVEEALGIDVPTREEMEEIEISSRLYEEGGAVFMTAILPERTDTDEPVLAPVTFVLAGGQLVTVRYHEPSAFRTLPLRAAKAQVAGADGASLLIVLLEMQVDRLADVLERNGRDIHGLSRQVFQRRGTRPAERADFQQILETLGREGDLTSNIAECLVSLDRMVGFLAHVLRARKEA